MAGLLLRAIGGAAKGVGDGMLLQAKNAREDAIAALAHTNAMQMQQAGFTHSDTQQQAGFTHDDTSQLAQFGQQNTITNKEIAAHHADAKLGADTSMTNTSATIAGEKARQDAAAGEYGAPVQADDGTMFSTNKLGKATTVTNQTTGQPTKALGRDIPSGAYSAAIKESTDTEGVVDQDKLNSIIQTLRMSRTPNAAAILPTQPPKPGFWGGLFGQPADAAPVSGGSLTNPTGAPSKQLTPPGNSSTGNNAPPPAPPKISKVPNLQYSASKNQYRDPASGAIYDVNGNPVKQ